MDEEPESGGEEGARPRLRLNVIDLEMIRSTGRRLGKAPEWATCMLRDIQRSIIDIIVQGVELVRVRILFDPLRRRFVEIV